MKGRNICIVNTIYALFLYLLNAKDEEIDRTIYIFNFSVPEGFEHRVKNGIRYIKPKYLFTSDSLKWKLNWLIYRLQFLFKLPILRGKDRIYMQDHVHWQQMYIYKHEYTFIEDSPNICFNLLEKGHGECREYFESEMKLKKPLWFSVLYGPVYGFAFATHKNASSLLLTESDPSEFLKNRKRILIPKLDENLWSSFSDFKRNKILQIFDIRESDLVSLKKSSIWLLTQPLYPDLISLEEHKKIYERVIRSYNQEELIIKTHPRDFFDYCGEFGKDLKIFSKPVPQQLLSMIGLKIAKAVTVYSSAVNQLNCDVDWYGTEISTELFSKVGHIPVPKTEINNVINIKI